MSDLLPANENPLPSGSSSRDVRVLAGSRLHFGLLDTVDPFGGVGLMVQQPQTEVWVSPSQAFAYVGPASARAEQISEKIAIAANLDSRRPPCQVHVKRHPPAHCGLGSGTQLAMAVAEGICRFLQLKADNETISLEFAARGKRSALGLNGYAHGGLIFESSTGTGRLNEIQCRVEMPEDWCVAILRPQPEGDLVHGKEEVAMFAKLPPADLAIKQQLNEIAVNELMVAAAAGDFNSFASAVSRYNRLSGMLFAGIQGGPYNGLRVTSLVKWLNDRGVGGVGQSSWGPGVFAWF
jgi:beta-ribofuranosylaminobenzene 5'-phosphate synthase